METVVLNYLGIIRITHKNKRTYVLCQLGRKIMLLTCVWHWDQAQIFPAMVCQQLIQEVAVAKIYLMMYPSLFLSRTVQSVLSENTFSLCYIESSISIIETVCVKLSGELWNYVADHASGKRISSSIIVTNSLTWMYILFASFSGMRSARKRIIFDVLKPFFGLFSHDLGTLWA